MTMPRDYARCMGSEPHLQTLCVGCARYHKNNNDPEGERVVYADYKPFAEQKLSGSRWVCFGWKPLHGYGDPRSYSSDSHND